MATRINKRQTENAKDLIQVSQLVKTLKKHADGEREMTNSQVNAARFLISLVLPTMKAVEQTIDMTLTVPKNITFKVKK